YPDINQLNELLVTSLKPKLSKLLASHDSAICLPTKLKELPSKITKLSREVKELKKHVRDMEIKLHGDFKDIPNKLETFTSTVSSLTSQSKGKEVVSSKDAKDKETESNSKDDHANLADSMVESANLKKLNKFSFVTKGGEQFHFNAEKIKEQKED
nr:hypothetical protein [Tanacetum cinerariifolium]